MSGSQALHTVTRLLKYGDQAGTVTGCVEGHKGHLSKVIANEDIYGGMHRLLTQEHGGVIVVVGGSRQRCHSSCAASL